MSECAEQSLTEMPCGVCGKLSVMFFVHGYRCKAHEFQREPSDAIVGENVIVVASRGAPASKVKP